MILFAVGLIAGVVVVLGALGGKRLAQADRDREAQEQTKALERAFDQAREAQKKVGDDRERWAREARQATIARAMKHVANGEPDMARGYVEHLSEKGTDDLPPELVKLLPR